MRLTNEIITRDVQSLLAGEYLIAGVFIVLTVMVVAVLIGMIIACVKKKISFSEHKSNLIVLAVFSLFAVGVISTQINYDVIPLKNDIVAQDWQVQKAHCISKSSTAIPNVEDFRLRYENIGEKSVDRETYMNSRAGTTDYIITLSNGKELIYSSTEYTY